MFEQFTIFKEVKTMAKVEMIYAIDTMGKYPVAFVQYEGFCPQWKQYNRDIIEYLNTHKGLYAVNDPYWKY